MLQWFQIASALSIIISLCIQMKKNLTTEIECVENNASVWNHQLNWPETHSSTEWDNCMHTQGYLAMAKLDIARLQRKKKIVVRNSCDVMSASRFVHLTNNIHDKRINKKNVISVCVCVMYQLYNIQIVHTRLMTTFWRTIILYYILFVLSSFQQHT